MGEDFLESEVIFSDPHDHLVELTHVSDRYASTSSTTPELNMNHRRIESFINFNNNTINYNKFKSTDRSAPFKIPTPPAFNKYNFYRSEEEEKEEEEEEEEEYFREEIMVDRSRSSDYQNTKVRQGSGSSDRLIMVVPPHLIVARRVVASFVFAHSGRPLRGRNLCEVRNSILRMTGFLET